MLLIVILPTQGCSPSTGTGPIIGIDGTPDMDETNATQAVRLLAVRLPSWTVWYGRHTGHFWALPVTRDLAAAPHIESRTAAQLEQQAWEIERCFRAWPMRPQRVWPISHSRQRRTAEAS
ncbi:hypothetical protein Misp02_22990 [Microtetraspora sp. NBRC 16547]|nr:hypothetical protein Misp02_22990 [Microtetraspora sp. NBRC 16547]